MKSRYVYLAAAAIVVGALVWLAFFWQASSSAPPGRGQPFSQAPAGGDFHLKGPDGRVALADYRGKVVVIYFGYAFCPDVCPTSLAAVAQAFSLLAPAELERVGGLFISLDPERDTTEILGNYAPFFHPAITGVTGSSAEIAQVARQYGVFYAKQKTDANGAYTVDHSSLTYIVAPDGSLAASLPHNTSPEAIAEAIRALLKKPAG
jgi:protein SCO1/2